MDRWFKSIYLGVWTLPFLFVSTAYSQVYFDGSSSHYVKPTKDERASGGTIAKPTAPMPAIGPEDTPDEVAPAPTPKPVVQMKNFSFGRRASLPYGPAVVWNGCSKTSRVTGGKGTNTGCDEDYMHPKMAAHMEKYFYKCVVAAAEDAGIKRPERVHLNQAGCFQNRNVAGSGTLSLHALARAIDINQFNLISADGTTTRISANKRNFSGKTKTFYNSFRSCWRQNLPSRCHGSYTREREGSIGLPGAAMSPTNWDHADHMHVTFPPCGG